MNKPVVKTAALLSILGGFVVASPSFAAQRAQRGAGAATSAQSSTTPPAVSLKDSLTAAQQQALTALLDRFQGQLTDIGNQLKGSTEPSALDKGSSSATVSASTMQAGAAKAAFGQLKSVQAQIDNEMASLLSRTQLALHKKAVSTSIGATDLAKAAVMSSDTSDQSPPLTNRASLAQSGEEEADNPVAAGFVSSYCSSAAQYSSSARYYAYYAYLYAYYNYVSYSHADSNAYNAYVYLNTAQSNALLAVKELSAAYFNQTRLNTDFDSLGAAGYSDAYDVQYWAYYGYRAAYNDYLNTGRTYAYYAYLYGYYAYSYGLDAYNYGGYCR